MVVTGEGQMRLGTICQHQQSQWAGLGRFLRIQPGDKNNQEATCEETLAERTPTIGDNTGILLCIHYR